METEEKVKNKKLTLKLIIMLLIIILISALGLYACARYVTSIDGQAEAQTARFAFKVNESTAESRTFNIESTRLDTNKKVGQNQIAPDTYGVIPIEIDASESDVSLIYNISIKFKNKPQNLKFYTNYENNTMSNEIKVINDEIMFEKYLSLEDKSTIQNRNVYWSWEYETGDYAEQIEYNDEIDSDYMNKKMETTITVTGMQAISKPTYLADVVSVGDYVNYDASSGGEYSYTTDSNETGTSGQKTFSSISNDTKNMKWRVLSINREAGLIELTSEEPTQSINLHNESAYKNFLKVLDNISNVYSHGKGCIYGRSMVAEDIDQYSTYNKNNYKHIQTDGNTSKYAYGDVREYTTGKFYKYGNLEEIYASATNPVKVTMSEYGYYGIDYIENNIVYEMLFNSGNYFLASPMQGIANERAYYGCLAIRNFFDKMALRYVFFVYSYEEDIASHGTTMGVRPVVVLKQNIQTSGQDEENSWNLKT